ncbi:MAG TPA: type II toxin-antitoxin system RelE/ParE family toxin [Wenzhouxiangella sp.]|nr:type II toxin-antitoxin system RelE/ParE family toxin [Wenzhouxiangella sp.]
MAKFEIVFKRSVGKDLRRLPKKDVQRILACIDTLADNPRPPEPERLSAQKRYRIRAGRYRILYEIQDHRLIVTVIKVGHRGRVYRPHR